jgi:hypothetical protein
MFAPSSLDQQLAATWNAAREDLASAGGGRRRHAARRRRLERLVRAGR